MRASVLLGVRFGFAAAVTVAIAIFTLSLESWDMVMLVKRAGPPLPVVAWLTCATFIWSYMVSAGTASVLRGVESIPAAFAFTSGVVFALLTPLVGYLLVEPESPFSIVTMLVWIVVWPVLSVTVMWRVSRPNTSLERTREG